MFGCMFCSDMAKLSHLLPAVNQLETLCGPQPFLFSLECACTARSLHKLCPVEARINASFDAEMIMCAICCHSHTIIRGFSRLVPNPNCQSH